VEPRLVLMELITVDFGLTKYGFPGKNCFANLEVSITKVKNDFNAWNESLDIVKELALASIDRQVLEQFIGAVEKADASLKNILYALCSLYALFYGIL
jgi:hypothetical protein